MPTFEYQAMQNDGTAVSGHVYGTTLDQALKDLQGRGLAVSNIGTPSNVADPLAKKVQFSNPEISVSPRPPTEANNGVAQVYQGVSIAETPSVNRDLPPGVTGYEGVTGHEQGGPSTDQRSYFATSVAGPLVNKVGLPTVSFFFSQLSTMLKAGVPMVQSLDTLSGQSQDPRFRGIVRELRGHVEAGRPITAGMQRYPEVFSVVALSIVRIGEEGGFLDDALKTASEYVDDEIEIKNLYRRVTIYPKILVFASMIIIIGANLIISMVAKGGRGLSSPLTNVSTWFILGPLLIGLFLFFRVGLANPRMKYIWDAFLIRIPYLGKTLKLTAMAKFGRAFGAMYKSGVPITKIVPLAADACGNEYMRAQMYPAAKVLESGAGITETMRSTGALSPMVYDMLSTGEKTGNIDMMLGKVSDYYHDEAKTRAVQTGHVIGVLVLLLVGIYIGYIVISFYTGYFGNMMSGV
jgi:type II secretory pathway component PulF